MEEKKTIRKDLIGKRDSLNTNVWIENSNIIQRNIMRSELYNSADCILCYADFHGEVGTLTIIENALMSGKHIFLPKVVENFIEARMEFYEVFSTNELIGGYKGIMEPTGNVERVFDYEAYKDKNVLMLVPGVAFSKDGYRLGYGKGYYDHYLCDKPNILKCGLCFSMQIIDDLPVNENDVKMDMIISERTSFEEINKYILIRG